MDHFQNPRNVGKMINPDGIGKQGNPICGDVMELAIKVNEGIIEDAKFQDFRMLRCNSNIVDCPLNL